MTTASEPLIPGPDHPIDIEPYAGRVRVTFGHHTIADTTSALELREASYPPVYYVPMADVDHAALRPSDTTSYCPYKGDASYYDVIDPHTLPGGRRRRVAVPRAVSLGQRDRRVRRLLPQQGADRGSASGLKPDARAQRSQHPPGALRPEANALLGDLEQVDDEDSVEFGGIVEPLPVFP